MPLKFYNTLSREKEDFTPLSPPSVTFYSCGPTVYDYAHIGNLRSYVFADNLKKMRELAEFYTEKFKEDLIKLNIKVPSEIYYASDYVKEDIELVQRLEEKGYTYKTSDGIYFNTSKMPDY